MPAMAVAGEQVTDLSGQLHLAPRQQDEVVGDPLQLGQHMRGQQNRHAVGGHRRQHRGHEVVPGHRVELRHRLVEHQQPWPAAQGQGQRELRLLAAGQLSGLALRAGCPVRPAGPAHRPWSKCRFRLRVRCIMSATDRFL